MCRSIKVLRRPDAPATGDEISAAALQFVRKVSGYHKPSKSNQEVFDAAVREIAAVTGRLLETLHAGKPPRAANGTAREGDWQVSRSQTDGSRVSSRGSSGPARREPTSG
jgi:hypothetical protein